MASTRKNPMPAVANRKSEEEFREWIFCEDKCVCYRWTDDLLYLGQLKNVQKEKSQQLSVYIDGSSDECFQYRIPDDLIELAVGDRLWTRSCGWTTADGSEESVRKLKSRQRRCEKREEAPTQRDYLSVPSPVPTIKEFLTLHQSPPFEKRRGRETLFSAIWEKVRGYKCMLLSRKTEGCKPRLCTIEKVVCTQSIRMVVRWEGSPRMTSEFMIPADVETIDIMRPGPQLRWTLKRGWISNRDVPIFVRAPMNNVKFEMRIKTGELRDVKLLGFCVNVKFLVESADGDARIYVVNPQNVVHDISIPPTGTANVDSGCRSEFEASSLTLTRTVVPTPKRRVLPAGSLSSSAKMHTMPMPDTASSSSSAKMHKMPMPDTASSSSAAPRTPASSKRVSRTSRLAKAAVAPRTSKDTKGRTWTCLPLETHKSCRDSSSTSTRSPKRPSRHAQKSAPARGEKKVSSLTPRRSRTRTQSLDSLTEDPATATSKQTKPSHESASQNRTRSADSILHKNTTVVKDTTQSQHKALRHNSTLSTHSKGEKTSTAASNTKSVSRKTASRSLNGVGGTHITAGAHKNAKTLCISGEHKKRASSSHGISIDKSVTTACRDAKPSRVSAERQKNASSAHDISVDKPAATSSSRTKPSHVPTERKKVSTSTSGSSINKPAIAASSGAKPTHTSEECFKIEKNAGATSIGKSVATASSRAKPSHISGKCLKIENITSTTSNGKPTATASTSAKLSFTPTERAKIAKSITSSATNEPAAMASSSAKQSHIPAERIHKARSTSTTSVNRPVASASSDAKPSRVPVERPKISSHSTPDSSINKLATRASSDGKSSRIAGERKKIANNTSDSFFNKLATGASSDAKPCRVALECKEIESNTANTSVGTPAATTYSDAKPSRMAEERKSAHCTTDGSMDQHADVDTKLSSSIEMRRHAAPPAESVAQQPAPAGNTSKTSSHSVVVERRWTTKGDPTCVPDRHVVATMKDKTARRSSASRPRRVPVAESSHPSPTNVGSKDEQPLCSPARSLVVTERHAATAAQARRPGRASAHGRSEISTTHACGPEKEHSMSVTNNACDKFVAPQSTGTQRSGGGIRSPSAIDGASAKRPRVLPNGKGKRSRSSRRSRLNARCDAEQRSGRSRRRGVPSPHSSREQPQRGCSSRRAPSPGVSSHRHQRSRSPSRPRSRSWHAPALRPVLRQASLSSSVSRCFPPSRSSLRPTSEPLPAQCPTSPHSARRRRSFSDTSSSRPSVAQARSRCISASRSASRRTSGSRSIAQGYKPPQRVSRVSASRSATSGVASSRNQASCLSSSRRASPRRAVSRRASPLRGAAWSRSPYRPATQSPPATNSNQGICPVAANAFGPSALVFSAQKATVLNGQVEVARARESPRHGILACPHAPPVFEPLTSPAATSTNTPTANASSSTFIPPVPSVCNVHVPAYGAPRAPTLPWMAPSSGTTYGSPGRLPQHTGNAMVKHPMMPPVAHTMPFPHRASRTPPGMSHMLPGGVPPTVVPVDDFGIAAGVPPQTDPLFRQRLSQSVPIVAPVQSSGFVDRWSMSRGPAMPHTSLCTKAPMPLPPRPVPPAPFHVPPIPLDNFSKAPAPFRPEIPKQAALFVPPTPPRPDYPRMNMTRYGMRIVPKQTPHSECASSMPLVTDHLERVSASKPSPLSATKASPSVSPKSNASPLESTQSWPPFPPMRALSSGMNMESADAPAPERVSHVSSVSRPPPGVLDDDRRRPGPKTNPLELEPRTVAAPFPSYIAKLATVSKSSSGAVLKPRQPMVFRAASEMTRVPFRPDGGPKTCEQTMGPRENGNPKGVLSRESSSHGKESRVSDSIGVHSLQHARVCAVKSAPSPTIESINAQKKNVSGAAANGVPAKEVPTTPFANTTGSTAVSGAKNISISATEPNVAAHTSLKLSSSLVAPRISNTALSQTDTLVPVNACTTLPISVSASTGSVTVLSPKAMPALKRDTPSMCKALTAAIAKGSGQRKSASALCADTMLHTAKPVSGTLMKLATNTLTSPEARPEPETPKTGSTKPDGDITVADSTSPEPKSDEKRTPPIDMPPAQKTTAPIQPQQAQDESASRDTTEHAIGKSVPSQDSEVLNASRTAFNVTAHPVSAENTTPKSGSENTLKATPLVRTSASSAEPKTASTMSTIASLRSPHSRPNVAPQTTAVSRTPTDVRDDATRASMSTVACSALITAPSTAARSATTASAASTPKSAQPRSSRTAPNASARSSRTAAPLPQVASPALTSGPTAKTEAVEGKDRPSATSTSGPSAKTEAVEGKDGASVASTSGPGAKTEAVEKGKDAASAASVLSPLAKTEAVEEKDAASAAPVSSPLAKTEAVEGEDAASDASTSGPAAKTEAAEGKNAASTASTSGPAAKTEAVEGKDAASAASTSGPSAKTEAEEGEGAARVASVSGPTAKTDAVEGEGAASATSISDSSAKAEAVEDKDTASAASVSSPAAKTVAAEGKDAACAASTSGPLPKTETMKGKESASVLFTSGPLAKTEAAEGKDSASTASISGPTAKTEAVKSKDAASAASISGPAKKTEAGEGKDSASAASTSGPLAKTEAMEGKDSASTATPTPDPLTDTHAVKPDVLSASAAPVHNEISDTDAVKGAKDSLACFAPNPDPVAKRAAAEGRDSSTTSVVVPFDDAKIDVAETKSSSARSLPSACPGTENGSSASADPTQSDVAKTGTVKGSYSSVTSAAARSTVTKSDGTNGKRTSAFSAAARRKVAKEDAVKSKNSTTNIASTQSEDAKADAVKVNDSPQIGDPTENAVAKTGAVKGKRSLTTSTTGCGTVTKTGAAKRKRSSTTSVAACTAVVKTDAVEVNDLSGSAAPASGPVSKADVVESKDSLTTVLPSRSANTKTGAVKGKRSSTPMVAARAAVANTDTVETKNASAILVSTEKPVTKTEVRGNLIAVTSQATHHMDVDTASGAENMSITAGVTALESYTGIEDASGVGATLDAITETGVTEVKTPLMVDVLVQSILAKTGNAAAEHALPTPLPLGAPTPNHFVESSDAPTNDVHAPSGSAAEDIQRTTAKDAIPFMNPNKGVTQSDHEMDELTKFGLLAGADHVLGKPRNASTVIASDVSMFAGAKKTVSKINLASTLQSFGAIAGAMANANASRNAAITLSRIAATQSRQDASSAVPVPTAQTTVNVNAPLHESNKADETTEHGALTTRAEAFSPDVSSCMSKDQVTACGTDVSTTEHDTRTKDQGVHKHSPSAIVLKENVGETEKERVGELDSRLGTTIEANAHVSVNAVAISTTKDAVTTDSSPQTCAPEGQKGYPTTAKAPSRARTRSRTDKIRRGRAPSYGTEGASALRACMVSQSADDLSAATSKKKIDAGLQRGRRARAPSHGANNESVVANVEQKDVEVMLRDRREPIDIGDTTSAGKKDNAMVQRGRRSRTQSQSPPDVLVPISEQNSDVPTLKDHLSQSTDDIAQAATEQRENTATHPVRRSRTQSRGADDTVPVAAEQNEDAVAQRGTRSRTQSRGADDTVPVIAGPNEDAAAQQGTRSRAQSRGADDTVPVAAEQNEDAVAQRGTRSRAQSRGADDTVPVVAGPNEDAVAQRGTRSRAQSQGPDDTASATTEQKGNTVAKRGRRSRVLSQTLDDSVSALVGQKGDAPKLNETQTAALPQSAVEVNAKRLRVQSWCANMDRETDEGGNSAATIVHPEMTTGVGVIFKSVGVKPDAEPDCTPRTSVRKTEHCSPQKVSAAHKSRASVCAKKDQENDEQEPHKRPKAKQKMKKIVELAPCDKTSSEDESPAGHAAGKRKLRRSLDHVRPDVGADSGEPASTIAHVEEECVKEKPKLDAAFASGSSLLRRRSSTTMLRLKELEQLRMDQLDREKAERLEREREKEKEKLDLEGETIELEKERSRKLKCERQEKTEAERLEKFEKWKHEKLDRESIETSAREELEKERPERERVAKLEEERLERERLAKLEQERLERERLAKLEEERLERERLAKLEDERLERERLVKLEQERLECERWAKLEEERLKRERLAKLEKERLERERLVKLEEERLERERLAKLEEERLERDRLAKLEEERLELERLAKLEEERLERERLAKLEEQRQERERLAKLEEERQERERLAKLEQERLERERLAKLEEERLEREKLAKLEQERLERERSAKLEEERLERETLTKLEEERLECERQEKLEKKWLENEVQKKLEKERLEREKLEKVERKKIEREKKDREKREHVEREEKERQEREKKDKLKQEWKDTKEHEKKEKAKFERKEKSEREKVREESNKHDKMVWDPDWEREKFGTNKNEGFDHKNMEQVKREKIVVPELKISADTALKIHNIIPSAQMKRKSSRKRAFNSIIMNDAAAEESGKVEDVVPAAPLLKKRKSIQCEDNNEFQLKARRSLSIMAPMLRRRKKPVFDENVPSSPGDVCSHQGTRGQQNGKGPSGHKYALGCVREEGLEKMDDKDPFLERKTDENEGDGYGNSDSATCTSAIFSLFPKNSGEGEQKVEWDDKEAKMDFYLASSPLSQKLDDADSTLSLQVSCEAEDSPSRGSSRQNALMISSPSRSAFSEAASASRGLEEDVDGAKSGDASPSSSDDEKSNDDSRMHPNALATTSMVRHVELIARRRMKRSYSAMHGNNRRYAVNVNGKRVEDGEEEGRLEIPSLQRKPQQYDGAEDDSTLLSRSRGRPKKRPSLTGLFAPSSPLGRLVGRSPLSNDAMMYASPGHHAAASSSTYDPAMKEATVVMPEPQAPPVVAPTIMPAPTIKRRTRRVFAIGGPYSRFEGPVTRSRAKKKSEALLAAALSKQRHDDASPASSSSSSPQRKAAVDDSKAPERIRRGRVPSRIARSHVHVDEDVEKTRRALTAAEPLVAEARLARFPPKNDVLARGSIPRRGKSLKQSARKKRRTEHFNFSVADVDDRTCRMMSQGAHLAQCSRLMGTCVVSLEPAFVDTKIVGYRLVFCHGALQFFVRVGPLAKVLQLTALQFRGGLRHDALRGRGQKVRELLQQAERRFHVAPSILNLQDIPPFSFLRSVMFLHMVVRSCEQGLFV